MTSDGGDRLLRCANCREPFIITDNGVTCGCDLPIRGNVSAVIGMSESRAKREYPDNFQESPADGYAGQLLRRLKCSGPRRVG